MRKKQSKPFKNNKKYRKYSAETMLLAYEAVKEKNLSVNMAAKAFSVPVQTLRDRVKGNVDPHNVHLGSESVLSNEEEITLLEHVEGMADMGYHCSHVQMQGLAGDIAHTSGKRSSNKALSNSWLYGFLSRWKTRISSIKPRAAKFQKGKSSTPRTVDSYFQILETTLEEYGLLDKPHLIYNVDETLIIPEQKPHINITPINRKRKAVISLTSYCSSVISCVNAAGSAMPPYFVFEGKRFKSDLMKEVTPGTKGVVSETGFSNTQIFREYLENHFLPLVRQGTSTQHILLLFDAHSTNVSTPLIEWAKSKKLILLMLPAYTSHLLGPLDTGVFERLKRYYYSECDAYIKTNSEQVITKYDVCEIVCNAYMEAFTRANIKAGFRKTGIYPYSNQTVNRDKLFSRAWYAYQELLKRKQTTASKYNVKSKKRSQLNLETQADINIIIQKDVSSIDDDGDSDSDSEMVEYDDDDNDNNISENENEGEEPENDDSDEEEDDDDNGDNKDNDDVDEDIVDTEDNYDDQIEFETEESDLCCVCKKHSPPNINKRPYLKIVTWAGCDKCPHWVHLGFCIKQKVLRREDNFLCLHCQP